MPPNGFVYFVRGKSLVGHASPAELMLAFGHFDLVLDELRKIKANE